MSDFYNTLAEVIENQLLAHLEVGPDTAESVAADIITNLAKCHGGQTVYLKNNLSGEIAMKHKWIVEEYNGRNIRDLCLKYRMSAFWVKKIIKRGFTGHAHHGLSIKREPKINLNLNGTAK